MEIYRIAVRALFTFVFLLLLVRLSGKHTVSEGKIFDFVLALILGDMIDDALWADVPASQFVVASGTLVLAQIATAIAGYFSKPAEIALEGTPTVVMRDGKPVTTGLLSERMCESDLEALLRLEGLERNDWGRIRVVYVENMGELSVLLHEWAEPVPKRDRERLKEVA